jgi:multidrug efflux pump subunit AcrB
MTLSIVPFCCAAGLRALACGKAGGGAPGKPPMIGGVITSAVLNLLIYPVIYVMWHRRHLPKTANA